MNNSIIDHSFTRDDHGELEVLLCKTEADEVASILMDSLRTSTMISQDGIPILPAGIEYVPTRGLHLSWRAINYSITNKTSGEKTTLLDEVCGEAFPGQMICIMGGSGAGKTTLLNMLAGRIVHGEITGDIRVNGKVRNQNWKRVSGYVLQDTAMYPNLTVRETIIFSATLKLPRLMPQSAKIRRAEEIIALLGLSEVANNFVGTESGHGISGGQRRRVTIGIQLVSDPRLLFLDEPTTGLDSFISHSIVESLCEMATRDKKTIIMTIHQPRASTLRLFSKILLLSKGKTVFFGTMDEALVHLEKCGFPCPTWLNPADFFMDIITPDCRTAESEKIGTDRLEALISAWRQIEEQRTFDLHATQGCENREETGQDVSKERGGTLALDNNTPQAAVKDNWHISPLAEFVCLFHRQWLNNLRDTATVKASIFSTIILLVITCMVYFQLGTDMQGATNRIGLLFFLSTNCVFVNTVSMLVSFTLDRVIILQERYASTYRVSTFFLSTLLAAMPIKLLLSAIFSVITYYLTGLRTDGFQHMLVYLFICLLTTINSIAMGLFIGACFRTVARGFVIGGIVLTVLVSFSGNYANSASISWIFRWIQYLCNAFYTYQTLTQNEFNGRVFGGVPGEIYLQQAALNQMSLWSSTVALVGLTLVFTLLGCAALRSTTKPGMKLVYA